MSKNQNNRISLSDKKNKEYRLIYKIIIDSIKKTNLDLTGLNVLTEAATGYWAYTPIIAFLANASSVTCITKNTKYGTTKEIIQNFSDLNKFFNFNEKIKIYKKLNKKILKNIDIITNSGHVRPINHSLLQHIKHTAVVALMWEPWEFREEDIDIRYCFKNGICVLGTNEDNSKLNILNHCGELILKISKLTKTEFKNKKIIMVAENKTAIHMIESLKLQTKSIFYISKNFKNSLLKNHANVIGESIEDPSIIPYLKDCDVLIINSAPSKKVIIGENGISPLLLKKLSPNLRIIVFFGKVDFNAINCSGIQCYPKKSPPGDHMEWNFDILEHTPTIQLAVVGLKSVEDLAKLRKSGLTIDDSIQKSLKNKFCLDFSKKQKKEFTKSSN